MDGSLDERRFVAVYIKADDRFVAFVGAALLRAARAWREAILERRRFLRLSRATAS